MSAITRMGPLQRGQVIPADREVTLEAVVTAVNDNRRLLRADGYLSVDGRIVYGMKDFTLHLSPAEQALRVSDLAQ